LQVGEALVSMLDEKGMPGIVQRAFMLPPTSKIGPVDITLRQQIIRSSPVYGHYETSIDRESAYEKLTGRIAGQAPPPSNLPQPGPASMAKASARPGKPAPTTMDQVLKVANSPVARQIEKSLVRGIMGSLFGSTRRR
jgi:DNA helicase HerA-like ATPase